jgi:microcompartment protein CcmK/EutM
MFVARVTGSVVSSQKVSSMIGHKLLIVEPLRVDPANRDKLIGDATIIGIIDTVSVHNKIVFSANGSNG